MTRVFHKLINKPANPLHYFAFQGVCLINVYPAISSFIYSTNPNELENFTLYVYHNIHKIEEDMKKGKGTIFYLDKSGVDKLIKPFEHLAYEHIIPLSSQPPCFCKGCNKLNNFIEHHLLSDKKDAIDGLMGLVFGGKEI